MKCECEDYNKRKSPCGCYTCPICKKRYTCNYGSYSNIPMSNILESKVELIKNKYILLTKEIYDEWDAQVSYPLESEKPLEQLKDEYEKLCIKVAEEYNKKPLIKETFEFEGYTFGWCVFIEVRYNLADKAHKALPKNWLNILTVDEWFKLKINNKHIMVYQ